MPKSHGRQRSEELETLTAFQQRQVRVFALRQLLRSQWQRRLEPAKGCARYGDVFVQD